ncbi:MAG: JAB domain-containing protein [Proteobacteria bacterium]|nr:JAB domain-containing protein [Pseudomonadota bacterium]
MSAEPKPHVKPEEKTTEKPDHLGHRKRLRERLLTTNTDGIQDYELLEVLLYAGNPRGDTKPLAKKLIKQYGSLAHVLSTPPEQLLKCEGLGEAAAASIAVVRESALRLIKWDVEEKPVLQSWKALLDYCRASMAFNRTEQFRIFFLDTKNQLIADELQQEGTIDHTPVYPREVVKRALELSASALILVHNHPSGDVSPSKADIEMTRKIKEAAAVMGVRLHDHLVIGGAKHYSFASHGLL